MHWTLQSLLVSMMFFAMILLAKSSCYRKVLASIFCCPCSFFFSHTDGKIQKGLFLNGAGSLKSDCSHQVCQSTLPVLGLNQAMQVVPGMFAEFFC